MATEAGLSAASASFRGVRSPTEPYDGVFRLLLHPLLTRAEGLGGRRGRSDLRAAKLHLPARPRPSPIIPRACGGELHPSLREVLYPQRDSF